MTIIAAMTAEHSATTPLSAKKQRGAVSVDAITKMFGSVKAVDGVSLSVQPGEFVALLGASGSGKSTLLMMIAGFEAPSSGDIKLDGVRINDVPGHRRGFGMVFQNYALFPHMTVAENIAYPLRRRGMSGRDAEREVTKALKLVALDGYGARLPSQLSGGQQQRVALARALVFRPPLLLMDEPLGALDRKLRQQLQMEIKLIHKEVGSTIIFVTHDQEEALSMADRVAVLERGRLQQFGSPRDLYEEPATAFVADFIGEMNFLPAELRRSGQIVGVTAPDLGLLLDLRKDQVLAQDDRGLLAVRPEFVRLETDDDATATVLESAYTGTNQSVLVQVGELRLTARTPVNPGRPLFQSGQRVRVSIEAAHTRVFPAAR
ncbi:ABC transporter ATP-binding protein [Bradyrhizobium icense]|uniref:Branched-chain amino acid ABC transporter substrate-binding protein n=1 Tax=Bradyrhizobium icense TaxID=1274631 RepID=A0A1B1UKV0_9BRAD|nr:ABC transporter ATP-binding protein [Bradyrhizobium icense]ANW03326.1 branched-chain amino acid ABC transporter substrate-binding protein [Bradyrhizobium icense]